MSRGWLVEPACNEARPSPSGIRADPRRYADFRMRAATPPRAMATACADRV
ncbi:hypothetical protein QE400_002226 [Xanthomonas sacchari]|nr:hypothetical protein [Xanthomonas sacchari]